MIVWLLDPAQLTPYYNIALCDALAQAGCDVRYLTSQYLYDDKLPQSHRFQTEHIYFRGLNYPWLTRYPRLRRALRAVDYPLSHLRLARRIRQQKPDILHIQWSRLPRLDRWLIGQAQSAGVRVVHTIHDVRPLYAPDASTEPLHRVYQAADRIIVHTEANHREFMNIYPAVDPAKIFVVPLITASNTARPPTADQITARQQLGLPADALILLFFGSIRHYKGLDILLSAFAQISPQRPNLHLLIAGRPETADDATRLDAAQRQANIHVRAGYIPYEDVWAYHLAADLAILPYRAITQSAALLSYMDFGLPVIVTNVGGLPESIDGNGWIVPPEDPNALADTLLDATSDLSRLHRMGRRSRELVDHQYSGPAVAARTMSVYNGTAHPDPG